MQDRHDQAFIDFDPQQLSWRARLTYGAHLFKACAKQHHRELIPALRRVIAEDSIVFDIGAHAGQFAKLFARLAPAGHVYAFEPGGYALSILCRAIRFRGLSNVTIVPCGLGDREGDSLLSIPIKRSGSCGFGTSHLGDESEARPCIHQRVRITTLDRTVSAHGIHRLDFIKADIEGWELRMLTGATDSLARFRPALLLEVSARAMRRAGDTPTSLWDLLTELGYQAFTLTHDLSGFNSAKEPRDGDFWWVQSAHAAALTDQPLR
jgi:FkbM family methyltransferase